MKKKIVSLCLVVCLLATAIGGATMAYFTDKDQNTNEFTVGKVEIDLYETVGHTDAKGTVKMAEEQKGKGSDTNPNISYTDVLPGDEMKKVVTVENTGTSDAYVALAVKMKNLVEFQKTLEAEYDDDKMATLVPQIFSGANWNMNHGKNNPNVSGNTMRFVPTTTVADADGSEDYRDDTATTLISIDAVKKMYQEDRNQNFINFHLANMFGLDSFGYISTDTSLTRGYTVYPYSSNPAGFVAGSDHLVDFQESATYADELEDGEQIWVFYYFLPAGQSVTLDLSMTCPTEITADTSAAFDGIDLDIRATAIQVDGFATAKEAFTELNKTYDFSY